MIHPCGPLRALVIGAGAGAMVALMTGCGSPSYHYATNTTDKVFFKVPNGWHQVDQDELDALATRGLDPASAAALKQQQWSIAYDADDPPSADHIVSLFLNNPIVYARVLRVPDANRSNVTPTSLRDVFVPVTAEARAQAAAAGSALGTFKLQSIDAHAAPDGLTGVHQVFTYGTGPQTQVFDQTAWTTKTHSRIYLLLVRCNDTCYAQRHDELDAVVKSFTVDQNGTS